jgi:beta-galactosidase
VTRLDRRQMMLTAAAAATAVAIPSVPSMAAESSGFRMGRSQPLDLGWRFFRGEGQGFEAAQFDDSSWRPIDLPHDWSVEDLPPADGHGHNVGPFDREAKGGTAIGFSVGGEGWYRRRLHVPARSSGRIEVVFDGVYMNSDVWLNGHHLGSHAYGYTPFVYDLTPYLASNGDDVIAVRVRNLGENSRWYTGSGIYRHVWLDVLPEQSRIARWGVDIATRRIADGSADIEIGTKLDDVGEGVTLTVRVKDQAGRLIKESSTPALAEVRQALTLSSIHLWTPDTPALYTLETELHRGTRLVDRVTNTFGIRIVSFDAQRGMTLNGVPTKLRGGCIHHDNGLLGAAAFDESEERKVRLLKARGFNAVRPSHNPFSAAFLDACDRHGLLVVGETFDTWHEPKLPQDYSTVFDADWQQDLTALVLSARNHPSIILWSIGNEIPGRNTPSGIELQWRLANEVHRLDPTRAVTAAINGFAGRSVTPAAESARAGSGAMPDRTSVLFLDVVGYNYKLADYEADHQKFPTRVLFGSESFPKDVAAIWDLTEKSPWLIGDFVWTAMDYLGEAGIGGSVLVAASSAGNPLAALGAWPWVNAYCGDIDLIGQQKAQSFARDVIWGKSQLEVLVRRPVPDGKAEAVRIWGWHDEQRSWSWPGAEGKQLTVSVYTVGDRVELQLNGRVLEAKAVSAADSKRIEFSVAYEPGVLEAIACKGDAPMARQRLATVGPAKAIRLIPEQPRGRSQRGDVNYIAIEIVDEAGHVSPDAQHAVEISLSGPAELIAFGSASPLAVGSLRANTAQTWNGRALLILRGMGRTGRVAVQARAEGLRSAHVELPLA